MSAAKDFYTLQIMSTFAGATGATMVITNGLQAAFNYSPRWMGLAVAFAVVLGTLFFIGGQAPADYAIGVVNAFLVYCSAAGVTGVVAKAAPVGGEGSKARSLFRPATDRRTFLSPWF